MTKSLLLICPAFLVLSCKEDITPVWLEIPSIELATDDATEGSNSHAISDAWVYMDGTALGVFELPAKIPVLAEGQHEFVIFAGVKNYGMSSQRIKYPFYERYEISLSLVKGETITLNPVVTYKSNLTFEMIEDFEDTGIDFTKELISD